MVHSLKKIKPCLRSTLLDYLTIYSIIPMGNKSAPSIRGRVINDTPHTLIYTIQCHDITLTNLVTETNISGDLGIKLKPEMLQLKGNNKITTRSDSIQNKGEIHVPAYQKSSVGLTLLDGQMKYLSIEVQGQVIFKNAPVNASSDLQIYVYVIDGKIRWKQVQADFKWESPEDSLYRKTREQIQKELRQKLYKEYEALTSRFPYVFPASILKKKFFHPQ